MATKPERANDILRGLPAIGKTLDLKDRYAVRRLIREEGLPATEVGRSWVSRMVWVNDWLDKKVSAHVD